MPLHYSVEGAINLSHDRPICSDLLVLSPRVLSGPNYVEKEEVQNTHPPSYLPLVPSMKTSRLDSLRSVFHIAFEISSRCPEIQA